MSNISNDPIYGVYLFALYTKMNMGYVSFYKFLELVVGGLKEIIFFFLSITLNYYGGSQCTKLYRIIRDQTRAQKFFVPMGRGMMGINPSIIKVYNSIY